MKITEGIVWEKKNGEWVKMLDNWPLNRRGARIVADDDDPFGNYGKAEAIAMIEGWITKGPLKPHHFMFGIIPGKEMTPEAKDKLENITAKKKAERGEGPDAGPVESYISEE